MRAPILPSLFSVLLLLSGFAPAARAVQAEQAAVQAVRELRAAAGHELLAEFAELLALPNDPARPEGVAANARWIVEAFAARGARMRIVELPGAAPLVIGRLDAPGAERTLGVYVHYDGQPVDAARWTFPPFEPTLCDAALEAGGAPRALPEAGEPIDPEWRLYARGSGDDRAPLIAWLEALDALERAGLPRRTNLVFLFEGEEEVGSPHLGDYLSAVGEELGCDLWLINDGPVHSTRRPQLVFGVRGIVGCEFEVYGAGRPLHSGHYGGWAPNAAAELGQLVAALRSPEGRVLVEGFYETVAPVSAAERAALAALPVPDEALRDELSLGRVEGEGETLAERLLLPSLNVRGLQSGNVGALARNVIPSRGTLSIDLRLVPGNEPQDMLDRVERHLEQRGYTLVREEPDADFLRAHERVLRVTRERGYPAARAPLDHPLVPRLARAVQAAAGEPPLLVPSLGGSLPLYLFEQHLGVPALIVGIANHDNNQHAPDENIRLANLFYGCELFAALLAAP